MKPDELSDWPTGAPPSATYCGEPQRVEMLAAHGYEALEDDPELTALAAFAARLCAAPIAFVSLVESEAQRFIARDGSDLTATPRSQSFCAHTMLGGNVMEVRDATADARFRDNQLVTGDTHVRFYAGAPLISAEGAPLGALCVIDNVERPDGLDPLQREGLTVLAQAVMRRLASRRAGLETDAALVRGEKRLQTLAESMPVLAWSANETGQFEFLNRAAAEYLGVAAGSGFRIFDFLHPDDVERITPMRAAAMANSTSFEAEARLRSADGSHRWMLVRALPVSDVGGSGVHWFGTATDIDDGHRLSEERDLLSRELSHRIKNIFAVVAGLVSIRARKHEPAKAFAAELVDAIRALGRAHDFVRPMEGVKGDSLRGLLAELMAPYSDANGRVEITGHDCAIGPRAATPLALIFHELATNAAKYGALSVEGGSIGIHIDCSEDADEARIGWRERGGPGAADPGADGFGSRLVQLSIEGQLGGRLERRFAADGLEIDLDIPVNAIRS